MKVKAYNIRVYGRVQRVGYRRYILDLAQELGLQGFVKNEKDGSVIIYVQGEEEKLSKFIDRIKKPYRPAIVREVVIKEAKVKPEIKYFEIKPGKFWEEFHEGMGSMQSIFMEYWREFRDYRNEFKDFRSDFDNFREEFREFRQEFREFRQEFRDFRQEFRDYREEFRNFAERTDKNFELILEKYGEISKKLTEILETLVKESRETRELILENIKLTRQTLEKLLEKLSEK